MSIKSLTLVTQLVILFFGIQAENLVPFLSHRVLSQGWELKNKNGSIHLNVSTPSYVLESLIAAGIVGDPLYRCDRGLTV